MRRTLTFTTALSLLFTMLFVGTPLAANAAVSSAAVRATTPVKSPLPGIVRVFGLRVREGASIRWMFKLSRNTKVTVLGLSSNHHWLKIRTADGRIGWVSAAYIKLVGGRFINLPIVQ